jgi:hypothetical protein
MISDKAMLICLHITMWTARKHDRRVSEEVAHSCNAQPVPRVEPIRSSGRDPGTDDHRPQ